MHHGEMPAAASEHLDGAVYLDFRWIQYYRPILADFMSPPDCPFYFLLLAMLAPAPCP